MNKELDFNTWSRKDIYNHFINNVRCVISITADIEITKLLAFCNAESLKFYPAMLYLITKAVNSREEFRLGYDESGKAVLRDIVYPSHIIFNEIDNSFTRIVTYYNGSFRDFYSQVLTDIRENENKRAFEPKYTFKNTFDVSCLPWINYKSCEMHVYNDDCYLAPVITWGKYIWASGKCVIPLSMRIHHATADGFHIARFFSDVESEIQKLTLA